MNDYKQEQVPCISLLAAIDRVLAGVPTREDGETCSLRDVRRVLEDNSAGIHPAVFIPKDDAPTPNANTEYASKLSAAEKEVAAERAANKLLGCNADRLAKEVADLRAKLALNIALLTNLRNHKAALLNDNSRLEKEVAHTSVKCDDVAYDNMQLKAKLATAECAEEHNLTKMHEYATKLAKAREALYSIANYEGGNPRELAKQALAAIGGEKEKT